MGGRAKSLVVNTRGAIRYSPAGAMSNPSKIRHKNIWFGLLDSPVVNTDRKTVRWNFLCNIFQTIGRGKGY
jgi:hypothetical protein